MKSTGKFLTLRGQMEQAQFQNWNKENILDYANVLDITKGWRVVYFKAWLGSYPSLDNPGQGVEYAIHGIVGTDDMSFIESNGSDNRQIAWSNQLYSSGGKIGGAYSDGLMNESYVIDPDHVIQKQLDIYFFPGGGATMESQFVDINYIVYLEEMSLTPNESIVSTIKQSAQNLEA